MENAGGGGLLPQLRLDDLLAELQTRLQAVLGTRDRMHGLLEAVVAIGSGLELEAMLRRIVEAAVDLVDAKYGALGVIGEDQRLIEFIPVGLDAAEISEIHHWPEGHGLLGLLIRQPQPLRLADIGAHQESSGFPDGHPAMRTFLGVPVRMRNRVFGNLYLTEKRGGGEFTEDDEAVLTALGAAAGVAVENARLYEEARRQQHWLRASSELTIALLSGAASATVLADLTRQALELSGADLVTLALPDEDGRRLTLEYAEGDGAAGARGLVVPAGRSLSGQVLASGTPVTVENFAEDPGTADVTRVPMGHIGPAALFPLGTPGNVRGVLTVGRVQGSPPLQQGAASVVAAFAAQAAVALELADRRADAERLSVFEDRDRIARDLHDLVIQRLYATGMSLEGMMPMIGRRDVADRVRHAVDAMDDTIRDIRATIFALQSRGRASVPRLRSEIVALADEMAETLGFAPALRLGSGLDSCSSGELSDQVLAVLREALSNVARHSGATRVDVTVDTDAAGMLTVLVRDNGCGIGETSRRSGLANMADRARQLGGHLRTSPAEGGGTALEWQVPVPKDVPEGPDEEDADLRPAPQGKYPLRLSRVIAEHAGRVRGRLRAALHAQLGEQAGDVVLDRLLREEEVLPDLPVRESLADQLEDPPFLRAQPGQRVLLRRLPAQPRHQLAGRARVEHRLPGRDRAYRADQVGAADLLEHVPRRAGHDRVHEGVVIGEGGKHQAGHLGHPGADLTAHGHTVTVGQPDVEHRHVRAQRRDPGERRRGRARLADYLDVTLGLEHVADAPPDDLVIVEQEHLDRLAGAVFAHEVLQVRSCPGTTLCVPVSAALRTNVPGYQRGSPPGRLRIRHALAGPFAQSTRWEAAIGVRGGHRGVTEAPPGDSCRPGCQRGYGRSAALVRADTGERGRRAALVRPGGYRGTGAPSSSCPRGRA
jgi:signal transduction histidine kinase